MEIIQTEIQSELYNRLRNYRNPVQEEKIYF